MDDSSRPSSPGADPRAAVGRAFFALAVLGSGLMQVANAEFVRLVPPLPAALPRHGLWATLVGLALVAVGVAMLFRRTAGAGAATLALLLIASFVLQRVPEIAADPWTGFRWTNPLKVLALVGGALLLARVVGPGTVGRSAAFARAVAERWLPPLLLGLFLAVAGLQHYWYRDFVDTLVPAWIPPGARFWTLATGVFLFAGGVGLIVPRLRRLAATCAGVMIFLWVVLLHVPRAWSYRSGFELAGVFEALAMSGIAFMLAGAPSLRVKPSRRPDSARTELGSEEPGARGTRTGS
jgi:uncharacterized membrane protein